MLDYKLAIQLDDAPVIASMKRGSRRSAARATPINTSAWSTHSKTMRFMDRLEDRLVSRSGGIVIAFPVVEPFMPIAANN